jgi:hypothetical protein
VSTPILRRAAAFFLPGAAALTIAALLAFVAAGLLAGLAILAVVAAIAAWLWPAGDARVVGQGRPS